MASGENMMPNHVIENNVLIVLVVLKFLNELTHQVERHALIARIKKKVQL